MTSQVLTRGPAEHEQAFLERPVVKLGAFALALAAVFGAAFGLGAALRGANASANTAPPAHAAMGSADRVGEPAGLESGSALPGAFTAAPLPGGSRTASVAGPTVQLLGTPRAGSPADLTFRVTRAERP
jgi:hypothetical protein